MGQTWRIPYHEGSNRKTKFGLGSSSPSEKHLRGAAPATAMTHIAIQKVEDGSAVD
jgi:hypothetical protein